MSLRQARPLLVMLLILLIRTGSAKAQTHFATCTSISGSSATLIISSSINPTIGDEPFATNDEIAVLTPEGLCAGVGVWDGSSLAITLWADDAMTSEKNGFAGGDSLHYRVWDASTNTEHGGDGSIQVQYDDSETYYQTDGLFRSNAIYALSTLQISTSTAPSLDAPSLLSPDDNATAVSTSPRLVWTDVPEASSYEIAVSTTSDFTSTVASAADLADTTFAVSGLSYETTYYWHVRALGNDTSGYSSTFQFTTLARPDPPRLLQPADQTTDASTSPTLTWNSVTEADTYRLQVSTASDFASTLVDASLSDTTFSLSGLSAQTTYYWRVLTVSTNGASSDFSVPFQFTTQDASPADGGILVTPEDEGTGIGSNVTFEWRAVDGAQRYNLEVSTRSNFAQLAFKKNSIKDTQHGPVSLATNTTYYWRIQAHGRKGFKKWSEVHQFTTGSSAALKHSDQAQDLGRLPDEVTLYGNYPNPVHQQTTITFALPERATATLIVYDMLGRVVTQLVNGPLPAGYHQFQWAPQAMASGQYLYRLRVGDQTFSRLLSIVR